MQLLSLLCLFCFSKFVRVKHFLPSGKFQWKWPQKLKCDGRYSNGCTNTYQVSLETQSKNCSFYRRLHLSQSKDLHLKSGFALSGIFFLKNLGRSKVSSLESYNFGRLTVHSATYSSLINFNHERRIRSSTLTSLCRGQLCTGMFCSSTPKATACVRSLTASSWCPSVPVVGFICPWSALWLAQSKACSLCSPVCWGKDRQGAEEGLALWESRQEKHNLALAQRWHPGAVGDLQQSTRLHSPHTGLRQRTLCLHSKSQLFIARQSVLSPMVISRNLTCNTGPAHSLLCSALPWFECLLVLQSALNGTNSNSKMRIFWPDLILT